MADMNDFESAGEPQVPAEEDPAAAFLAREQDQLAELEGDSLGADSSQPPAADGFDPFGGEAAPGESSDDMLGVGAQEPQTGGGGLLDGFGSLPTTNMATDLQGGDGNLFDQPIGGGFDQSNQNLAGSGELLDGFGSEPPSNMATDPISGDGDMFGQPIGGDFDESNDLTNGPTDSYSAISQVDRQRAEPEKIRVWREEQTKMLEIKDEEEEKKREEWRNQAKKELDDWYKHNAEQVTKTRENNRKNQAAAEAAFVKERDEKTSGHNWEKICRLCEFNPKNSKNMKDISRLRSILLQLKQTPLEC